VVPTSLVMIGDGPDRPAAEALCRQKGLSSHAYFLGNTPAVETVMPTADLYILTSDSESFGLSALEAQACGVPVLGYAAGGLPEVVADGETGFLRRVGDVDGLAAAAAELLLEPERYAEMAVASRQRAAGTFDVEMVIAEYLAVYERVLAGR
jgi:glycosyltransferase involved in cell wall biosynthesis